MKAFQLIGGSAEVDATTALNEVAQPDPGPGQVLIRIGGAGACHSDISLMEFSAGGPRETPMTLGHENAGWIEAFGPGTVPTPGLEIGSPVAVYGAWGCGQCSNCRKGMENYCLNISASGPGLSVDGGMAEYLLVPAARYLVPLGDMAPAEAAPLTDAGLTPYHAIKQALPLLVPGSFVVVIGAGGLGHLAVQFLKALSPATVVCVDQRESALKVVAGLGADHTVVMGPDASVSAVARCRLASSPSPTNAACRARTGEASPNLANCLSFPAVAVSAFTLRPMHSIKPVTFTTRWLTEHCRVEPSSFPDSAWCEVRKNERARSACCGPLSFSVGDT